MNFWGAPVKKKTPCKFSPIQRDLLSESVKQVCADKIGTCSGPLSFFFVTSIREVIKKKTVMKQSGWPIGLTPPPMNRSGKCEIFLLWFFTLVYDYIWPKTNFTKKIFFDHRKFLWRLLETLHDIHGFSCLGAVKKAIKIHQKCIFQPLHNEIKSVLGIKESYSMGKKSSNFHK